MTTSGEVVTPVPPLKRGHSFSRSLKTIFRSRSRISSKTKQEQFSPLDKDKSRSPVVVSADHIVRDSLTSTQPTSIETPEKHNTKAIFILGSGAGTVSATPEPIPIPNHRDNYHYRNDNNFSNANSFKATSLPPIGTEFSSGMGGISEPIGTLGGNVSDRRNSFTNIGDGINKIGAAHPLCFTGSIGSAPQPSMWNLPETVPIPELNEEESSENVIIGQSPDRQTSNQETPDKNNRHGLGIRSATMTTNGYNQKSLKRSEDRLVMSRPTSITLATAPQLHNDPNFTIDNALSFPSFGENTKQVLGFESDLDHNTHHHTHRRGSHSHVDHILSKERRNSSRTTHSRRSSGSNRRNSITTDASPPLSPQLSSEAVFGQNSAFGLESVRSNSSAVSFPHAHSSTKSNLKGQLSAKSSGSPALSSQDRTEMPYHSYNHHTPDDGAKCILNIDDFKVYDNGTHEHNLKMIHLVRSEQGHVADSGVSNITSPGVTKVSSGLLMFSGFFKYHPRGKDHGDGGNTKEKIEVNSKRFENAVSLIPLQMKELFAKGWRGSINDSGTVGDRVSRSYSVSSMGVNDSIDPIDKSPKKTRSSSSTSTKGIPKVVNSAACVSSDELELINIISGKILRGLTLRESQRQTSSADTRGKGKKVEERKGDREMKPLTPVVGDTNRNKSENSTLNNLYGNIVGVIGRGAYGIVSISSREIRENDIDIAPCTYSKDDRIYFAVKELRPRNSDQIQKFSTKITSEFIIGHSLSRPHKPTDIVCPNMPKIFDIMGIDGTFVEVMELCPSGDLYSLLIQKSRNKSGMALHPLEADCFMKQLLNGIKYMHDHGVAHCDIKPENILFHPNGLLKICDFGTSCVFQTAWERHVHYQTGVIGSEPYVAPEEFNKVREYDPRLADCWSCGIVYCTMILGHYLWKIALKNKDAFYDSFLEELSDTKEFSLFEELRHVNHEINGYRKAALYSIIQPDPRKRITIDELLSSPWMRRTRCCINYRKVRRTQQQ